jgi:hypothetical protein
MKSRVYSLIIICTFCFAATLALAPRSRAQNAPAQSAAPQSAPAKPNPQLTQPEPTPMAKEPDVPAADPVITIHNVCTLKVDEAKPTMRKSSDSDAKGDAKGEKSDAKADKCTEVLSRADFDKMLETFHPQGAVSQGAKQNLARAYVDWRVLEDAALKSKMEDDPEYQETMHVLRMRVLADMYHRQMEDKLKHASDADLKAYYDQHQAKYEEVEIQRVIIPKVNPTAPKDDQYTAKAEAAATEVHDRVAKGDDPDTVAQDAYTKLGITSKPMKSDIGKRRSTALGPQIDAVIGPLKPGEVSAVQTEPSGWVIYKLDTRSTPTLEQVKADLLTEYVKENLEAQLKQLAEGAQPDYNTDYFGPMVPQAPAGAATVTRAPRPATNGSAPAPAPKQ